MVPKHLLIAFEEIGVAEVPGPGTNPRIAEYLKSVGLPSVDAIPHCAAFVNWCLGQVGIPGTRSGMARSFLSWGYGLDKPQLGCIVVLQRGLGSVTGHTGFYLDESRGFLRILGANQGDRVGVNDFSDRRLLGYRWHPKII